MRTYVLGFLLNKRPHTLNKICSYNYSMSESSLKILQNSTGMVIERNEVTLPFFKIAVVRAKKMTLIVKNSVQVCSNSPHAFLHPLIGCVYLGSQSLTFAVTLSILLLIGENVCHDHTLQWIADHLNTAKAAFL